MELDSCSVFEDWLAYFYQIPVSTLSNLSKDVYDSLHLEYLNWKAQH